MPSPALPASQSAGAVRQLKWLVAVLAVSNIALGLFAVWALREADRRYSELVDHSVPVLNDLQTLTTRIAEAAASTNPNRLDATNPALLTAAHAAVKEDVTLRNRLLAQPWVSENISKRADMKACGEAFTAAADAVLATVARGDRTAAAAQRERDLMPRFQRYLDAVTLASDQLATESERINTMETAHTGAVSRIVLAAAAWPILAIVSLVLLTAAFVLLLMLLFRGREMQDAP
jgi:hypothetical protein